MKAYAISSVGQNWIAGLISIGALAGLTSVFDGNDACRNKEFYML